MLNSSLLSLFFLARSRTNIPYSWDILPALQADRTTPACLLIPLQRIVVVAEFAKLCGAVELFTETQSDGALIIARDQLSPKEMAVKSTLTLAAPCS